MSFGSYISCIIALLKSAILNTEPPRIPDDIDMGELFYIAMHHSIENILYLPICRLIDNNSDIVNLFEAYYNHSVLHDATQQYYLELVADEFEKYGIRHCIMKGAVIKPLYPSSDLRKSRDIDIFVDDENTDRVQKIMESLGFEAVSINKEDVHDAYIIDENIKIEVHRKLMSDRCPWHEECDKIIDRLIPSPNYKFRCHMSPEDYYLYMIAHMAKHMKFSGMGIKMVLDVWIYLRKYNNALDWDMLSKRFEEFGLHSFETNIRMLCGYWFDEKEADDTVKRLAVYIAESGNFGTQEQESASEMAQNAGKSSNKNVSRLVYYCKVFFWPYKMMKVRYKILNVMPILLPFCWIHRAVNALFFKREVMEDVMGRYDNLNMEYGKKIIELKKEIGL